MKKIPFIALLVLILGPGAKLLAADLPAKKVEPPPSAENIETLLATLNETLDENRRIRGNLKNLQEALEKTVIENETLRSKTAEMESFTLQASQSLDTRTKDLEQRLKAAEEKAQSLEAEKIKLEEQKVAIEKNMTEKNEESEKLKDVLSQSILQSEKEELVNLVVSNKHAAEDAVQKFETVNYENQALKQELIESHYALGNSFFKMQKYKEAVEQYHKALAWNPYNPAVNHNLAVIYDYYLDDKQAALDYYQKYLNYKSPDEKAERIRQKILDLTMLKKVLPSTPLKERFEEIHRRADQY